MYLRQLLSTLGITVFINFLLFLRDNLMEMVMIMRMGVIMIMRV